MKILLSTLLALLFAAGIFAQNQNDGQKKGSQNQSVVYFTRNVSSAGLLKVYRALNQKIEGNVGIKVSFGGPDEEVLPTRQKPRLTTRKTGRSSTFLTTSSRMTTVEARKICFESARLCGWRLPCEPWRWLQ